MKVLDLSCVDVTGVKRLLEESMDGTYKPMDDGTLYLFDLSPYEEIKYQTLIIQKNGQIYRSMETSNRLLETFARELHSAHEETTFIADSLGFEQKIPYVIGERGFIPSRGYTKKPASWLGLNHVERVSFTAEKKQVELLINQQLVLIISMGKETFETQVKRTAHILKTKLTIHMAILKAYNFSYRPPAFQSTNILAREFNRLSFEQPEDTYIATNQKLLDHNTNKKLRMILGEGNPYLEDYLNKLNPLT